MGDFNLDLLNCDPHLYTDDFLAMMLSNFFQPTHFLPSGKSTLIDNIFTNSLEYNALVVTLSLMLQITYKTSFLLKKLSSQNNGQYEKQVTSLSLMMPRMCN